MTNTENGKQGNDPHPLKDGIQHTKNSLQRKTQIGMSDASKATARTLHNTKQVVAKAMDKTKTFPKHVRMKVDDALGKSQPKQGNNQQKGHKAVVVGSNNSEANENQNLATSTANNKSMTTASLSDDTAVTTTTTATTTTIEGDVKNQPKNKTSSSFSKNVYNTNSTPDGNPMIYSNSIFTMDSFEVVPRLLVLVVGFFVTAHLHHGDSDRSSNDNDFMGMIKGGAGGQVPTYLLPVWFLMGICACQIFVTRPVIVISSGGKPEEEGEKETAAASPGKRRSVSQEFAKHETVKYETPPTNQSKRKSTRRTILRALGMESLFDTTKKSNKSRDGSGASQGGNHHDSFFPKVRMTKTNQFFTNLTRSATTGSINNHHHHSSRSGDGTPRWQFWNTKVESSELMDYLLVNFSDFRRKEKSHSSSMDDDDDDAMKATTTTSSEEGSGGGPPKGGTKNADASTTTANTTDTSMGHVANDNARATKLEQDMVIDPLFQLRGIDVFKTESGFQPEEKIWRQPILEENGLFDVPTFVVNLLLPWANLVCYFQMPDWVKKFSDIKEYEDDSEDTKALKRFLLGDANYRMPRWKILPCIVDGPFIIKAIAPAKAEVQIAREERLPVTWHQYDEQVDPKTGEVTRCALLEADCDLISDSAVRKILSIVKGQVPRVTIDCAMTISKPWDQEEKEPSACIGLWRIDKINMDQAAIIPEKDEHQLLQDFIAFLPEDMSKSIRKILKETVEEQESTTAASSGEVVAVQA